MTDNITLRRVDAKMLRNVLRDLAGEYSSDTGLISPEERAALDALDAALAEPDAIARAVEAEREACAKVCEPQDKWDDPLTAWSIAQAIRARGSK